MKLTNDDVQEILRLLDDSEYDQLDLQTENFSLTLRRSGAGWTQVRTSTQAPVVDQLKGQEHSAPTHAGEGTAGTETDTGLVDIRAPMVGTFYRAPKPGADPFVQPGDRVSVHSVIAIIEVMKLMNSIEAGINGEVVEILAEDAQFVEKGQVLMRARPDTA